MGLLESEKREERGIELLVAFEVFELNDAMDLNDNATGFSRKFDRSRGSAASCLQRISMRWGAIRE